MAAVLLGVLAALSWSLHDVFARSLAARIGPFRMAALVMIAGAILLTGFILHDGTVWRASWTAIGEGLLLGLAYGFGVGGLFKAFSLGPISLVGPVTAGYPVLALLWGWGWWLLRHRPRAGAPEARVALWFASGSAWLVTLVIGFANTTLHHEHAMLALLALALSVNSRATASRQAGADFKPDHARA